MTIKTAVSYSCAVLCSVVIVGSLATNYWLEFKSSAYGDNDVEIHEGLFNRCGRTGTCDEKPGTVGSQKIKGYGLGRAVLIGLYIAAFLLNVVAFVFITTYVYTQKYYFPIGRVVICFALAAICVAVGLVMYALIFKDVLVDRMAMITREDTAEENVIGKEWKWFRFQFDYAYGFGWSMVGMYVVTTVLMYADK